MRGRIRETRPHANLRHGAGDMAYIFTVANAKGGCGKTTVALNLAVCFSKAGYRTLAIDLDQQGNLSAGLGVDLNPARLDDAPSAGQRNPGNPPISRRGSSSVVSPAELHRHRSPSSVAVKPRPRPLLCGRWHPCCMQAPSLDEAAAERMLRSDFGCSL